MSASVPRIILTTCSSTVLLLGCPGGGGGTETSNTSNTGSITDSSGTSSTSIGTDSSGSTTVGTTLSTPTDTAVTGSGSGTGGVCHLDEQDCEEPPNPPAGEFIPSFQAIRGTDLPVNSAVDCPETSVLSTQLNIALPPNFFAAVYHPGDEVNQLPEFPDGFGLLIMMHGNSLVGELYDHMLLPAAERGVIALSIFGDVPDTTSDSRSLRILCLAEAVLSNNIQWVGEGRLSGEYAIVGHSTGGLGAYRASKRILDLGLHPNNTLVGFSSIAPNPTTEFDFLFSKALITILTIQGSGDGDTSGAVFSHFDTVRALPPSGGHIDAAPRVALVWAYDVPHTHWGGSICTPPSAKVLALLDVYMNAFVETAFYNDQAAQNVFFAATEPTPVIPPSVQDPALWPNFGSAQVYGTSKQYVVPTLGYDAWAVDRFENASWSSFSYRGV